ncbi:EmrB/QacA subfamily drug resistance transporter [Motilibacter peucedani]|uniref:EmrB/QacA subfamily drug resistance transporter n=1 Tax=Motilibacter peucedani TaxID=598650 RepID=A0A420XKT6_9ACTN|nr:MFS transporter [Motilibacter peucedani]RKS68525.1 EmrB/QacA subfamily drug resistance transporter [Motilibacter peucedani]
MTPSETATAAPPGRWTPLLAVCLGTFMLLLDVSIVNVALPDMATTLDASFTGLQWVVDAYALALAALLLLVGSIADAVGRRRTYLVGLAVFLAASLVCGIAPSVGPLVAARFVQGAGAAAMLATTIALLHTAYHGRDLGTAFGVWGATSGAAVAAGPVLGGLLTQGLSWRWIFFVNVPIGLVTIVMARRTLSESRLPQRPRIDWVGGGAFTLAAAALTFALVRAAEEGWTSGQTLGAVAVSVAALAAFVAVERRVAEPMLDLALLRRGSFVLVLVAAALLSISAFAGLIYVSIWLQTVLDLGPISAGLVTLPLSGIAFVVAGGLGRVLHGVSPRWTVGGGLVVIGVGDLLLLGLDGGSGWAAVLPGLAVIGVGTGIAIPTVVAAAMAAVPRERGGMAAGAVNTGRQLGFAAGIGVLGSIFSARVDALLPGGADLAHAVSSGGSASVLAAAPASSRASLDAAIHSAVGGALGTTFLVAGVLGVVGGAVVAVLLHEPVTPPAPGAAVEQPVGAQA